MSGDDVASALSDLAAAAADAALDATLTHSECRVIMASIADDIARIALSLSSSSLSSYAVARPLNLPQSFFFRKPHCFGATQAETASVDDGERIVDALQRFDAFAELRRCLHNDLRVLPALCCAVSSDDRKHLTFLANLNSGDGLSPVRSVWLFVCCNVPTA